MRLQEQEGGGWEVKKTETEEEWGFVTVKMRIVSQSFGNSIVFLIKHFPIEVQSASSHLNVTDSSSHFG